MEIYTGNACFNDFKDMVLNFKSRDCALEEELKKDQWKNIEILLAFYAIESYEGNAFVLFLKDGKLFEVNGSHCSCYGLEGQWEPEETTKEYLLHRINEGQLGGYYKNEDIFATKLKQILNEI